MPALSEPSPNPKGRVEGQPVFLLGPTASGKHETALELAGSLGAEIVSVDSMKVYRGMDIGTAKPSKTMLARVAHHLIDTCDPSEVYSAGRFVEDARRAVAEIESRGKRALFVGGTSLYYKAFVYGFFEGPPADAGLRAELIEAGEAALHDELKRVDPTAAARIHPNDLKRLVRAVEVFRMTGKPISESQTQFARTVSARVFCLRRTDVANRIDRRIRKMFEQGLVDEVKALMARPWSREGRKAVGYREVVDFLEGRVDLKEAEAAIVRDTNRFSKRQATWFRSFKEAVYIDATDDPVATAKILTRSLDTRPA